MTAFARRLREAMDQAMVTQAELAARTGVSRPAISQYLAGKNTPQPARVKILAEALGVPEEYFSIPVASPEPQWRPDRISTRAAAQCMGKAENFVRIGLQRGLLPFGSAVPTSETGKPRYSYYISPDRFRDYVGPSQFDQFFGAKEVTQDE